MMSKDMVKFWILNTTITIKTFLLLYGIPFEDGHGTEAMDNPNLYQFTNQITFPWCEGDVVIGTLHSLDDYRIMKGFDVMDEGIRQLYPSIETYHFPWDHDDITVFGSPEKFIKTIVNYYRGIVKKGEHRDE